MADLITGALIAIDEDVWRLNTYNEAKTTLLLSRSSTEEATLAVPYK